MFNIKRFAEIFNNQNISARWTKLKKNKHFMYGMPFVILVVGAPHVLYHINTVRYEYRNQKWINEQFKQKEEEALKGTGIRRKPPEECTVEKIYEDHMKKHEAELDDYKMIRGPRPWEQPSDEFLEQQKWLEEKNKDKKGKFASPRAKGIHY